MTLPGRDELKSLLQQAQPPCVSLFLPTHRSGAQTQQDPIRLKNLLRQVEPRLAELGLEPPGLDELLQPARALLRNGHFWQHQRDGLAVYLAPNLFRTYRVPISLEELAVVGRRFQLTPLLPLLTEDGLFYVLALSQNRVRLLEATRHRQRELDSQDIPAGLEEVVGYDWEQRSLQFRSGTAAPAGPRGRRPALFHGHGSGEEDAREELLQFLRRVDAGILKLVRSREAPLVLAAVDYMMDLYREVSRHPALAPAGLEGNPDHLTPEILRDRAWELVEPRVTAAREESGKRFEELASKGLATGDLEEVVMASSDGRVETLFAAVDQHVWGVVDPDRRQIRLVDPDSGQGEDLVDLAATETLVHGGTVYAVARAGVPGGDSLGAILRY